jgi:hypothetical protein
MFLPLYWVIPMALVIAFLSIIFLEQSGMESGKRIAITSIINGCVCIGAWFFIRSIAMPSEEIWATIWIWITTSVIAAFLIGLVSNLSDFDGTFFPPYD